MKKTTMALLVSGVATLISLVGLMLIARNNSDMGMILVSVGMVTGLVSYIFGGISVAFRMSRKIAKVGFYVAPIPINIVTGLVTLFVAFWAFLFIPFFPIRKACKEGIIS